MFSKISLALGLSLRILKFDVLGAAGLLSGELPAGVPLQTVKVGTPVIALEIIPDAAAAEAQLLLGGGDGTVRLWTPACRKASKALATLKYIHDEYAGILRLSPDGGRLLSYSRSGQLQLWRRGKGGVKKAKPSRSPPPAARYTVSVSPASWCRRS